MEPVKAPWLYMGDYGVHEKVDHSTNIKHDKCELETTKQMIV